MGDNYSEYCEQLDLSKLVTNDTTKELTPLGIKKAAQFSEGNKFLYDAIESCWKHGIKTFACCSGHEGKEDDPKTNYYPYLGIMIDETSLPYIKNIVANLQDIKDVKMGANLIQKEENWGPDAPSHYKGFQVSCSLPNRCEVFYKIFEALECKNMEKDLLSHSDKNGNSASNFYDEIVDFYNEQNSIENKYIGYDNWSQELALMQWQKSRWQRFKENKIVRLVIEKLFPKEKEKRMVTEQYKIGQKDYNVPLFSKINSAYYNDTNVKKEVITTEKKHSYNHGNDIER